jgi:ferrochelatase
MEKIAVVMFNLGGPDSKEAIRPFLMNFFTDKNIINLPYPLRYLIASRIAASRTKKEAGESYAELGNKSPLLENSQKQANALENHLNKDNENQEYKCFVCMRYWHPMSAQVVREVKDWGADRIVIMPLYPQFSTTTTWSSLGQWNKECKIANFHVPTSMICCYPEQMGYVSASAKNIKAVYKKAEKETELKPRVLFSAHGLPESIVKKGDPYQWQCEQSAKSIADKLNIESLDWQICYQSRVGPKKWIGPSTEEAIDKAISDDVPVVIYPHAFTQEHVETLVEIEIEYREIAEEKGIKGFYRAPTVNEDIDFIDGLAHMVRNFSVYDGIASNKAKRICPSEFGRCCMART